MGLELYLHGKEGTDIGKKKGTNTCDTYLCLLTLDVLINSNFYQGTKLKLLAQYLRITLLWIHSLQN